LDAAASGFAAARDPERSQGRRRQTAPASRIREPARRGGLVSGFLGSIASAAP
jgi:predicted lipid-binding transport protein (Tim44 family)